MKEQEIIIKDEKVKEEVLKTIQRVSDYNKKYKKILEELLDHKVDIHVIMRIDLKT